jgi:hypothetical protein
VAGYETTKAQVEHLAAHTREQVCESNYLGAQYNGFGAWIFSKQDTPVLSPNTPNVPQIPSRWRSATYDVASIMHYNSWTSSGIVSDTLQGTSVDRMPMAKWKRS